MTNTKYTAVVVAVVFIVTFAGGAVTYAQFSDTETATGSFTAGTTTPTVSLSSSAAKGLSFVAFCVVNGSSGSVTITNRTEKTGGDRIQINYTHTFDDNLTSVVNKAGPVLYEDNSSDGTVVSGEVNVVGRTGNNASGRQPSTPCGDGAVAIKFEESELGPNTTKSHNDSENPKDNNRGNSGNGNNGNSGNNGNNANPGNSGSGNNGNGNNGNSAVNRPVNGAGKQNSVARTKGAPAGTFGAQSVAATSSETDDANGSNAKSNSNINGHNTNIDTDANSTNTDNTTDGNGSTNADSNSIDIDTNTDSDSEGGDINSNANSTNNTAAARNEMTTNQTSAVAIHILGNSSSDNEPSENEQES